MTFCGVALVDGVAWAWADAEAYDGDTPTGRDVKKMGVSSDQVVVVGAGDGSVLSEVVKVAEALKAAPLKITTDTLGEAARYVATTKRAYRERKGDELPPRSHFGLVGFEGGRLRGFTMSEAEDFRPHETEAWASPAIASRPRSAAEVLAVALAQLEIVKREIPRATGRALTIAKIGPLGVATTTVRL